MIGLRSLWTARHASSFDFPGGPAPGPFWAAGAAVSVWLAWSLGALGPLDEAAYDALEGYASRLEREPSAVLVVEGTRGPADLEVARLLRLLGKLEEFGAAGVALLSPPADCHEDFFKKAEAYGNVVFGRAVEFDAADAGSLRPALLPKAATADSVRWGLVAPPPAGQGVVRRLRRGLRVGDEWLPSLEALAACSGCAGRPPAGEDAFLVNFRGRAAGLPRVSFDQVLGDRLVRELVAGKTALVGYVPTEPDWGRPLAAGTGGRGASPLELRALGLDTLLTGRPVREPAPVFVLAALLLLGFASLPVVARSGLRGATAGTGLWVVACVLAAGVARCRFDLSLPVVEAVATQALLLCAFVGSRALLAERAARRLELELAPGPGEVAPAVAPVTAPVAAPEPWALVETLLHQTQDVGRSIFFERPAGAHALVPRRAVNCVVGDVLETTLDIRCPPYSAAVERRGPVRVDGFLRPVAREETQYLVPMSCAGQVLGFWAFGIAPAELARNPDFEEMIGTYGGELGRWLDTRRRQARGQGARDGFLRECVTFVRAGRPFRRVQRGLSVLKSRVRHLDGLLDEAHAAAIVYDLFGRTLEVNARMTELLQKRGFSPRERSILDLVRLLTGQDESAGRRLLRHVVQEKAPISVPVTLPGEERKYLFSLRALLHKGAHADGEDPPPFHIQGIVCELLDMTASTRLSEIKGLLSQKLSAQLRNHFAAIELAASMAGRERITPERRSSVLGTIHARVKDSVDVLVECERYLTQEAVTAEPDLFPVDPRPPLARALEAARPLAKERGASIEVTQPEIMGHVLASPVRLHEVFEYVVRLLLHDVVDNGKARVEVEEKEKTVSYRFSNTGCGLPNDQFREYLFGAWQKASGELLSLRKVLELVHHWGGEFEAESEVGVGMRLRLELRRFI